jgi:transposase
MDTRRDRWAGLVRGWRRSGQTAREFAESAGVNAGTLAYWAWRLKLEGKGRDERSVKRRPRSSSAPKREGGFVELIVDRHEDGRFELELGDGRRLRIPVGFDATALGWLLTVLGEARR